MGLFKAVRNYAARTVSDNIYNKDKKAAGKTAYSETGKAIRHAKKHGYRINGSETFKKKYAAALEQASLRRNRREGFISDL